MVLKEMFVCRKFNSSVGYSTVFRKYVIAITVAWSVDYKRYYEITKEEYFSAKENEKSAKALTAKYRALEACADMLFSERISENNTKQLDLMWKYYESNGNEPRGTKQKAEENPKSSSKTRKQRAGRTASASKSKALARVKDRETRKELAEIGFAV